MLQWLTKWFRKSNDNYDVYQPEERRIYRYFNGSRMVYADPIMLHKALMDIWIELVVDIKVSHSESKDAAKAHTKSVEKIRKVFDILPLFKGMEVYDEEKKQATLTNIECLNLMDHFLTYCGFVKKNSSPLAISSTDLEASSNTSPESLPITNTSDSGSIESEPKTENPGLSVTESKLPLVS